MKKSIQHALDEYMYDCEFVQKLQPETLRGHRQVFATLIKLQPDISLDTLSSHQLIEFFKILQERKRIVGKGKVVTTVKKSTVATYWSKFNTFFEWLKRKNYIEQNPLDLLTRPTPLYEDRQYLRKEEIERLLTSILLHSANNFLLKRNLTTFYLFLLCGLRREELMQLQVRDIDLDKKMLTVRAETSKVKRTRYIPIHSQLAMSLADYLAARKQYTCQHLIVSSTADSRLTNDGLKHFISTISQASGVQFHVHQFRHTFAVNFLKTSNNIAKLQQLLGHKQVAMTLLYVRCLPPP